MRYSEDLEIYRNSKGNYSINKHLYYLKICKNCGEKCLVRKDSDYCSTICGNTNKNMGRVISKETRNKISKSNTGKKHSEETKQKISENKKKLNEAQREKNPNWKGGITKLNIPLFNTFASQLEKYEEVRKSSEDYLEVKCTYCDKWFVPKASDVQNRIKAINGKGTGECRLYCSKECKQNCPIYHKTAEQLMKEDAIQAGLISPDIDLTREVQPELRKLVFKRDNWICIKCGSQKNLHCHHIEGIQQNPIESADIDICITVCKPCHKDIHKQKGCRYVDLQCKKII